jgi:hypothetical protein
MELSVVLQAIMPTGAAEEVVNPLEDLLEHGLRRSGALLHDSEDVLHPWCWSDPRPRPCRCRFTELLKPEEE